METHVHGLREICRRFPSSPAYKLTSLYKITFKGELQSPRLPLRVAPSFSLFDARGIHVPDAKARSYPRNTSLRAVLPTERKPHRAALRCAGPDGGDIRTKLRPSGWRRSGARTRPV